MLLLSKKERRLLSASITVVMTLMTVVWRYSILHLQIWKKGRPLLDMMRRNECCTFHEHHPKENSPKMNVTYSSLMEICLFE